MALKTDIRGMVHEYPDCFEVGREKVREYARAVKNDDAAFHDEAAAAELGYDSLLAPLTFVSTLALLVQQDFFRNVDDGFETMQIVQVDQQFIYHKPIRSATGSTPGLRSLGFRAVRRGHRRHPQRSDQRAR